MTSLSSIANLSNDRTYWVDGNGAAISGYQLQEFLSKNSALFANAANKNIAIFQSDRAKTAQLLYLLDGLCLRLFVVPAEVRAELLPELFKQFSADLLVTDKEGVELSPEVKITGLVCDDTSGDKLAFRGRVDRSVNTEWIVATSGTTGVPKLVVHTLTELSGSLKKDQIKGNEFIWGLLYDLSKYAGLQVYLQSLLGGSTLLIPDEMQSLDQQILYFADNKCNALSATPTLWRKILMLPVSQKLQLKRITLGGEIADQPIIDALARQFPNAKIVHIYASTEAGVGFAVGDRLAGFPNAYLAESTRGVLMKVVDNRLFLKSANVSKTILNTPSYKDSDGYVDTGDLVELKGDRYYFLGRASGLINVGGNKVYPEEVEQILLSHEQIKLARVYGKKSHLMGNLVVCDMVIDDISVDSISELKKQVRVHCSQYLPDWKIPALFKIVDNIDNGDSGKQIRR